MTTVYRFKLKYCVLCFFVFISIRALAQDKPLPGQVVTDDRGVEMVYVPSGVFEFGITVEQLSNVCINLGEKDSTRCTEVVTEDTGATYVSTVQVAPFWMDRYEVSVDQFQQICSHDLISFPDGCPHGLSERQSERNPSTRLPDSPMVGISWFDALRLCNARGARLPTEAEWEYAASGPDNLIYPWGNEFRPEYTHLPDEPYPPDKLRPIGSIPENRSWIGIYDLAGNAAEYVEDIFITHITNIIPIQDFRPQSSDMSSLLDINRVARGGSWEGRLWPLTTFWRQASGPFSGDRFTGFRCAMSSDPQNDQ